VADQPQDQLTLPKTDAGLLFRLEMWATNVLLGYWWVVAVALVVVLAGVAIYGFWDSQNTATQRAIASRTETVARRVDLALIDRQKLKAFSDQRFARIEWSPSFEEQEIGWPPVLRAPLGTVLDNFGRDDVAREPVLVEAGDELLGIARAGGSTAEAAHAALLAAEFYRIAGAADSRVKALEQARGARPATLRFSAESALAQIALADGDLARAESLLRPWIDAKHGWHGQKAALDLAEAYRDADRKADAVLVLKQIKQLWPVTVYVDEVDAFLEDLGEGAPPTGIPGIDLPMDLAPGETFELTVPGAPGSGG
jgi:hypothetical protein